MNRLLELCSIDSESFKEIRYHKGRIVDDTDSSERYAVLVCSGRVDVFAVSPDGREVLLSSLSDGCLFGISNLFTEDDLRTVLQCREDSSLVFIPKKLLKERIVSSPEAMAEYSMICNNKIQFLLSRIEQLSANTSRSKLIEFLLSDIEKANNLTRTELASTLGISRAALFREIAYLQEKGAIAVDKGKFTILELEKLISLQI